MNPFDKFREERDEAVAIRKEAEERAERAELACAEMRRVLKFIRKDADFIDAFEERRIHPPIDHAISSDCGKGWLSPERAKRLREALEKIAALKDGKRRLLEGGCQQIAQQALRETDEPKRDDGWLSPEKRNQLRSLIDFLGSEHGLTPKQVEWRRNWMREAIGILGTDDSK